MVLRCFQNSDIIHVESDVNPVRDLEIINTELILKDLETVEKRLGSASREAKTGDKKLAVEVKELELIKTGLQNGKLVRQIDLETDYHRSLNLLTAKEQLFLLNGSESDVTDALKEAIEKLNGEYVVYDLAEEEIDPVRDRPDEVTTTDASGRPVSNGVDLSALIQKAYKILNLISFFTTGEKETRAWTIRKGSKAPEAAGVIHTDFQNKFIRAEVINWQKLLEAGSWNSAKQKGWIRTEGKTYEVLDGDTLVIHHS
jgi:ribosome-binding ATPase